MGNKAAGRRRLREALVHLSRIAARYAAENEDSDRWADALAWRDAGYLVAELAAGPDLLVQPQLTD